MSVGAFHRSPTAFRLVGRALAVFACVGILLWQWLGIDTLTLIDFHFMLAFLWAVAAALALFIFGRPALRFLFWAPVAFMPPLSIAFVIAIFPAQS